MRRFQTFLLALLPVAAACDTAACQHILSADSVLSRIPHRWVRVQRHDSAWAVLEYCNAGAETITLMRKDSGAVLYRFLGQESERYTVRGGTGGADSLALQLRPACGDTALVTAVMRRGDHRGAAYWRFGDGDVRAYVEAARDSSSTRVDYTRPRYDEYPVVKADGPCN